MERLARREARTQRPGRPRLRRALVALALAAALLGIRAHALWHGASFSAAPAAKGCAICQLAQLSPLPEARPPLPVSPALWMAPSTPSPLAPPVRRVPAAPARAPPARRS